MYYFRSRCQNYIYARAFCIFEIAFPALSSRCELTLFASSVFFVLVTYVLYSRVFTRCFCLLTTPCLDVLYLVPIFGKSSHHCKSFGAIKRNYQTSNRFLHLHKSWNFFKTFGTRSFCWSDHQIPELKFCGGNNFYGESVAINLRISVQVAI